MNNLRVGLVGISLSSSNFGCAALGYGFIENLDQALANSDFTIDLIIFDDCSETEYYSIQKPQNITVFFEQLGGNRKHKDRVKQREYFSTFDLIFDFTAGDSFSDIYGMKRLLSGSLVKINAIKSSATFVLGNQTYGPYNHFLSKLIAGYILRKADYAFSRDSMSERIVKELFGVDLVSGIDVAFALPYKVVKTPQIDSVKKKIGINVSGLLWTGGYTRNNQFGLKCDYKAYTKRLIEMMLREDLYDIFIIPHVVSSDLNYPDNDLIACEALRNHFNDRIRFIIPENPIEAKSYIASMDVFIGARMHATIAAFSSGVATIPFAYSRKFKGVFEDLSYNIVVDGKALQTEKAVEITANYLNDSTTLKSMVALSQGIINRKNKEYKDKLGLIVEG